MERSHFDGGLLELVVRKIVGVIITTITFGIAYPWALCLVYSWEVDNTVIEGRRLKFIGRPMNLFGHWIKWLLLTIITFGIYGFWVSIAIRKWKVKNTIFL